MADIITNILGYDKKLTSGEAPFDTLPTKRVELGADASSYAPKTGTRASSTTISKTLIKTLYRIFEIEGGAKDKGAIGKVAFKNVAEYVSSRGDDTIDIAVYDPNEGFASVYHKTKLIKGNLGTFNINSSHLFLITGFFNNDEII